MAIIRRTVLFCTAVLCAALPAPAQPIAHDDTATLSQDGPPLTLDVAANDTFTAPFPFLSFTPIDPAQGTLAYNNGGTFTFTPAPGFYGDLTFQYTLKGDEAIVEESVLHDPTGATYTAFGKSVAVDADTAVVGAPTDSTLGPAVGAVYIYTRTSSGWSMAQRIENPAPTGTTFFGECVGISGNNILVSNNHGTEYELFQRVDGSWLYAGALVVSAGGGVGVGGQHFSMSNGYAAVVLHDGPVVAKLPDGRDPALIKPLTTNRYFTIGEPAAVATNGMVSIVGNHTISGEGGWETFDRQSDLNWSLGLQSSHSFGDCVGIAIDAQNIHGLVAYANGRLDWFARFSVIGDPGSPPTWWHVSSIPIDPMPLTLTAGNSLAQLAVSGNYGLVGSYADATRPLYAGLYRFENYDIGWSFVREIGQPAGAYQYASTALSQNHALIGMAYDSQPTPGTGTVRPVELYPTSTATVTIHVTPTFLAVDDHADAVQGGPPVTIDVVENDTYPDPLLISSFTLPNAAAGALTYDGMGHFTFTPAPGFAGKATFQYTLQTHAPSVAQTLHSLNGDNIYGLDMDGDQLVYGSTGGPSDIYNRIGDSWAFAQRINVPGHSAGLSGDVLMLTEGNGQFTTTAVRAYKRTTDGYVQDSGLLPFQQAEGFCAQCLDLSDGLNAYNALPYGGGLISRDSGTWTSTTLYSAANRPGDIVTIAAITVDNNHLAELGINRESSPVIRVTTLLPAGATQVDLISVPGLTLSTGITLDGETLVLSIPGNPPSLAYMERSPQGWQTMRQISIPTGFSGFNSIQSETKNGLTFAALARSASPIQFAVAVAGADGWQRATAALFELPVNGPFAKMAASGDWAAVSVGPNIYLIHDTIRESTATVTIDVHPQPPIITNTYPIRGGRAYPGGTLTFYRSGNPAPIPGPQADANGAFLSDFDTFPYIGETLTAIVITADGVASAPSAPVLIINPCPLPAAPANPSPADAATFVEPNITLHWDGLPGTIPPTLTSAKSASSLPLRKRGIEGDLIPESTTSIPGVIAAPLANALQIPLNPPFSKGEAGEALASPTAGVQPTVPSGWEESTAPCGAPVDIEAIAPANGVAPWDGRSFGASGVLFSPASGADLLLARDEIARGVFAAYIESSYYPELNAPADAATTADFLVPVDCVSLHVLDADNRRDAWSVTAYDADGVPLASLTDTPLTADLTLHFPGIRRVVFDPSADLEGFSNFAFTPVNCPVTYDLYLGTSPLALTKAAGDLAVPSFTPALALNTTYYWKVVSKGATGEVPGPIWSFTTRPRTVVRGDAYVLPLNAPPTVLPVLANDTSDLNPLTIATFTPPSAGTLSKNADNTFTYQPPSNFHGSTSFTYTVADSSPGSIVTGVVSITVTSSNRAPVVVNPVPDLSYASTPAQQGLNATLVFSDPDGDTLTYTVAANTNPALLTVARVGAGFTLTFAPGVTGEGDVTLRATDPGGLYVEDTFHVRVGAIPTPPVVTQQPISLSVHAGQNALFTCAATSSLTLTYRWQKDGNDLNNGAKYFGTATPQLGVLNAANADEGDYRCRISNGIYTVYTDPAKLTVHDPYLVTEPADTTGGVTGTASFTVAAEGSGTLAYQWFRGNTPLADGPKYSGANTARLSIKDLIDLPQNTDEGYYHVEVKGFDPAPLRSRDALLLVGDPVITIQPQPQTVREGADAQFSVVAVGTPPLVYRWRRNGNFLNDSARYAGTQSPTLTLTDALASDAGDFSCVVVGQEIATSSSAALTIARLPQILGVHVTPPSGIVARGAAFDLELILDGPVDNATFAWQHEGSPLSEDTRIHGSATTTLHIDAATEADAGHYTCTLTDGVDTVTSAPALLRIGLAFITDLADAAGEDGKPFAWHTEVAGADGPLTWTWFRITQAKAFEPVVNTGRISGADTGTLHFDPLTYDDAGGYLVYALDTTDVAISRTATLTVAAELPAATALGLAALAAATALAAARRTRAKGAAPCAR